MKKFKLLILALLLATAAVAGETFGAVAPNMSQNVAGGGVTAKVTYLNPKSPDEPRFQVVLDTHSVNLDIYDLKTISLLRDDAGNTYPATTVENKGSGHHREGTVSFAKIPNGVKRVELVLKDIAGVKERIFRWDLD